MLYQLLSPLLLRLDAELSHDLVIQSLKYCPWLLGENKVDDSQPINIMGLKFKNRIGLAAGLDKNADCINAFSRLGFGFIEVGTVTPRPQKGNPKPRLFRLNEDKAIINRMGFNNKGVEYLLERVKNRDGRVSAIVGINIGKNKDTSLNDAANDYTYCLQQVYPYADYCVINISSPNTPGLRDLQQIEYLEALLNTLKNEQRNLAEKYKRMVPLVLKISPDLNVEDIKAIANLLLKSGIEGVIATNTTITRPKVYEESQKAAFYSEQGGLSGKPLLESSTEIVKVLHAELGSSVPIIAVGGIDSLESAEQKMQAGASLIQVYSGFIYQGPQLIRNLIDNLK